MMTARLVAILVAISADSGPLPPSPSSTFRLLAVLVAPLALLCWAGLLTVRTERHLLGSRTAAVSALRRFHRGLRQFEVGSLIVFLTLVFVVGWPSLVRHRWGMGSWILLDELIILMPYIVTELTATTFFLRVDRLVDRRTQFTMQPQRSLLADLNLKWRSEHGLWIALALITSLCRDIVVVIEPQWQAHPVLASVALVTLFLVLLALLPLVLRFVWVMRPLPEGESRTQLLECARRERVRLADLLLWRTPFRVANAGVVGIVPHFRYVFLSETLADSLSGLELVGVFGHEIGHVRHKHLIFQVALLIVSIWMLILAGEAVEQWVDRRAGWESVAVLFDWLPAFFFLAVPYVMVIILGMSRRFEKQADLAGCRAISGLIADQADKEAKTHELTPRAIHIFMQSLQKVCFINGIDTDQWMWRHGRVRDRIRFLEKVAHRPELGHKFHRRTVWACWTLLGTAALITIVLLLFAE